jgi:hypothetical protein
VAEGQIAPVSDLRVPTSASSASDPGNSSILLLLEGMFHPVQAYLDTDGQTCECPGTRGRRRTQTDVDGRYEYGPEAYRGPLPQAMNRMRSTPGTAARNEMLQRDRSALPGQGVALAPRCPAQNTVPHVRWRSSQLIPTQPRHQRDRHDRLRLPRQRLEVWLSSKS